MAACGTYAGWIAHRTATERPCDACRDAHNDYQRRLRARKKPATTGGGLG